MALDNDYTEATLAEYKRWVDERLKLPKGAEGRLVNSHNAEWLKTGATILREYAEREEFAPESTPPDAIEVAFRQAGITEGGIEASMKVKGALEFLDFMRKGGATIPTVRKPTLKNPHAEKAREGMLRAHAEKRAAREAALAAQMAASTPPAGDTMTEPAASADTPAADAQVAPLAPVLHLPTAGAAAAQAAAATPGSVGAPGSAPAADSPSKKKATGGAAAAAAVEWGVLPAPGSAPKAPPGASPLAAMLPAAGHKVAVSFMRPTDTASTLLTHITLADVSSQGAITEALLSRALRPFAHLFNTFDAVTFLVSAVDPRDGRLGPPARFDMAVPLDVRRQDPNFQGPRRHRADLELDEYERAERDRLGALQANMTEAAKAVTDPATMMQMLDLRQQLADAKRESEARIAELRRRSRGRRFETDETEDEDRSRRRPLDMGPDPLASLPPLSALQPTVQPPTIVESAITRLVEASTAKLLEEPAGGPDPFETFERMATLMRAMAPQRDPEMLAMIKATLAAVEKVTAVGQSPQAQTKTAVDVLGDLVKQQELLAKIRGDNGEKLSAMLTALAPVLTAAISAIGAWLGGRAGQPQPQVAQQPAQAQLPASTPTVVDQQRTAAGISAETAASITRMLTASTDDERFRGIAEAALYFRGHAVVGPKLRAALDPAQTQERQIIRVKHLLDGVGFVTEASMTAVARFVATVGEAVAAGRLSLEALTGVPDAPPAAAQVVETVAEAPAEAAETAEAGEAGEEPNGDLSATDLLAQATALLEKATARGATVEANALLAALETLQKFRAEDEAAAEEEGAEEGEEEGDEEEGEDEGDSDSASPDSDDAPPVEEAAATPQALTAPVLEAV